MCIFLFCTLHSVCKKKEVKLRWRGTFDSEHLLKEACTFIPKREEGLENTIGPSK